MALQHPEGGHAMHQIGRSSLHHEIVKDLIESRAIDLDLVGKTLSKFGARAALDGTPLVNIINRNVMWNCGWPGPELDVLQLDAIKGKGG
jgi:hypothetical protein